MPLYEYRCTYCRIRFEELVSLSGPDPACPRCGCPDTTRVLSPCLAKAGGPNPVKRLMAQRDARKAGGGCGSGSGGGGGFS